MGFLYGQDYCMNTRYGGTFVSANQGFIVSLSDEPCVADPSTCSASVKHVCQHVIAASMCVTHLESNIQSGPEQLCPIRVSCGGVVAKYVRVTLPGDHRILYLPPSGISIYKSRNTNAQIGDYGAYVVTVATPTLTRPEYIISVDPQDPVFYSTCYAYTTGKKWLQVAGDPSLPSWHFNGRCLDCDSYLENYQRHNVTSPDELTMQWKLNGACRDCSIMHGVPLNFTAIDEGISPGSNGDTGGTGTDGTDDGTTGTVETATPSPASSTGSTSPGSNSNGDTDGTDGTDGTTGTAETAAPSPASSTESTTTGGTTQDSAGGTDKDDDGNSKATILRSTLTITGIKVSDLNEGETLGKIAQSIASALKVPSGTVKIDKVTTARRRRLSDSAVVIRYSVTVMNLGNVDGVRERMKGLSSNVEVLKVVASQVGVEEGTLTMTSGSVVAGEYSTTGNGTSTAATDAGREADAGSFVVEMWMYVVGGIVVVLLLIGAVVTVSRRGDRDQNGRSRLKEEKKTTKAVAMIEMKMTNPAAEAGEGTIVGQPMSQPPSVPGRPTSGKYANARKSIERSDSSIKHGSGSAYLSNLYHTVGSMQNTQQTNIVNQDQLRESSLKHVLRAMSSKNEEDDDDGDDDDDDSVWSYDQCGGAPPANDQERTSSRRVVRKKKRSLLNGGEEETTQVETPFGKGKVLYVRKIDGCQVIELPWKLAGGSKAKLYRFSS